VIETLGRPCQLEQGRQNLDCFTQTWAPGYHNVEKDGGYKPRDSFTRHFRNDFEICCAILDQCEPGYVEFLHFVDDLAVDRPHRRRQQRSRAGQHGRIDGIGLGAGTGGLGEAPRLQRVHLGQWQAGAARQLA
jgi:hypothetical protein